MRLSVLQLLLEERGEFVERDQVDPVVQIHMVGAGDNQQLLRFARQPKRFLAELITLPRPGARTCGSGDFP